MNVQGGLYALSVLQWIYGHSYILTTHSFKGKMCRVCSMNYMKIIPN